MDRRTFIKILGIIPTIPLLSEAGETIEKNEGHVTNIDYNDYNDPNFIGRKIGDLYVNRETGEVWRWSGGFWHSINEIKDCIYP